MTAAFRYTDVSDKAVSQGIAEALRDIRVSSDALLHIESAAETYDFALNILATLNNLMLAHTKLHLIMEGTALKETSELLDIITTAIGDVATNIEMDARQQQAS